MRKFGLSPKYVVTNLRSRLAEVDSVYTNTRLDICSRDSSESNKSLYLFSAISNNLQSAIKKIKEKKMAENDRKTTGSDKITRSLQRVFTFKTMKI